MGAEATGLLNCSSASAKIGDRLARTGSICSEFRGRNKTMEPPIVRAKALTSALSRYTLAEIELMCCCVVFNQLWR